MATKKIRVPDNIEKAEDRLAALDGIATATGWERAAIVYAFTRDAGRGRPANVEYSTFNEAEFARLMKSHNVRGLTTRDSVRFNRQCWKDAIAAGEAKDVGPGDLIILPISDFPPQERSLGSRVSPDPQKAIRQVKEKHGAKALASAVEDPEVAAEVVENRKATRNVHQQSAARTRRIVNKRKQSAAANPTATAQTAAAVDAAGAAASGLDNSPEYNKMARHRSEMRRAWAEGIKEQSFTPRDRHYLAADLNADRRLLDEITAFVEAEDDPYLAVAKVRAEHEEDFHRQMDEAEVGTDFDTSLDEIEKFANEGA
jgi:hypothetical protein